MAYRVLLPIKEHDNPKWITYILLKRFSRSRSSWNLFSENKANFACFFTVLYIVWASKLYTPGPGESFPRSSFICFDEMIRFLLCLLPKENAGRLDFFEFMIVLPNILGEVSTTHRVSSNGSYL